MKKRGKIFKGNPYKKLVRGVLDMKGNIKTTKSNIGRNAERKWRAGSSTRDLLK